MALGKPLGTVAAALAGAGWWAVLGLALEAGHSGVEDAAVVGGWSLSLLPVHVTARRASPAGRARRETPVECPGRSTRDEADSWEDRARENG